MELTASGLPCEVQQALQDLPFKEGSLVLEQMDSKLHSLKDSRAILKSLGLHKPAAGRNIISHSRWANSIHHNQDRSMAAGKTGYKMRRPTHSASSQTQAPSRNATGSKQAF